MKLSQFITSSWPHLALPCLGAILCAFIALVGGASAGVTVILCVIIVGAAVAGVLSIISASAPSMLTSPRASTTSSTPLWITEMVDGPDYLEGRLAYDALRTVSKAAHDDVSEYRRQAQDYREYV